MGPLLLAAVGLPLLALLTALMFIGFNRWRKRQAERRWLEARQQFQQRREWLEARFLTLASQSGRPRGLIWVHCEFHNNVAFARDRSSGQLRALVAVTISFEAEIGGGMEEVEAVGNLRAATAVFHREGDRWETDGRAVFNLNPAQTIEHFQHELELVE